MPSEQTTLTYKATEAGTFPLRWFATWLEQQAGRMPDIAEIDTMELVDAAIKIVCRVPESADYRNNRARQRYGDLPS